jgi:hypothetical protein
MAKRRALSNYQLFVRTEMRRLKDIEECDGMNARDKMKIVAKNWNDQQVPKFNKEREVDELALALSAVRIDQVDQADTVVDQIDELALALALAKTRIDVKVNVPNVPNVPIVHTPTKTKRKAKIQAKPVVVGKYSDEFVKDFVGNALNMKIVMESKNKVYKKMRDDAYSISMVWNLEECRQGCIDSFDWWVKFHPNKLMRVVNWDGMKGVCENPNMDFWEEEYGFPMDF